MKKKTTIFEAIIAAIFIAATSFGQIARTDAEGNRINAAGHVVNKYNVEAEPNYFYSTEYFKIKIDWQGAVVNNEKIEHSRKSTKGLLMMRLNKGEETAKWIYVHNNEIEYESVTFHSFVSVTLNDGMRKGYFVIDYKTDARGNGIPAATIRICGELKMAWDENRKCWYSTSGDGYAVGWSEGGKIDTLTDNATWCSPSKVLLPIRGTVNIVPSQYLTETQKKSQAPKK